MNDILALFDVSALLDVTPVEVQDSPDSPIVCFSAEEVEQARLMIVQLLDSSVRSVVDSSLVDKAKKVVEVLVAEHRIPSPIIEFLLLPNRLNSLRNTLLWSYKTCSPRDLGLSRSRTWK